MTRTSSVLAALAFTALNVAVFQNCSLPNETDENNRSQPASVLATAPVERMCAARPNSHTVQYIKFTPVGTKYRVEIQAAGQVATMSESYTIRQNQRTTVSWPLGTYGTVTSYTANFPTLVTVTASVNGEQAPVTFTFDCN